MRLDLILNGEFNGYQLDVGVWDGKLVLLATQLSLALGYSRADAISNAIHKQWADDFVVGKHFFSISDEDLSRFDTVSFTLSNSKSRRQLLLTEAGVDLVILNTRKPAGRDFRRWLSDDIIPQLRRGMIEPRPHSELVERQKQEIAELQRKMIERDDKLLERDEEVIMLYRRQSELLGDRPYVKETASMLGRALEMQKRTKKIRESN